MRYVLVLAFCDDSAVVMSVAFALGISWKNSADVSGRYFTFPPSDSIDTSHLVAVAAITIFVLLTLLGSFSYSVTNIPLEANREGPPGNVSRPPWIRPVRKKTPSIARSNHSDSPSHHSSPEAFSPSDFFSETKPTSGFSSGPGPSSNGTSSSSNTSSSQYTVPNGTGGSSSQNGVNGATGGQQQQVPGPGSFGLDGVTSPMDMIREDTPMYMSSSEMMAFFGDGPVDVNHLFSPDSFLQSQSAGQAQQQSILSQGPGAVSPVGH